MPNNSYVVAIVYTIGNFEAKKNLGRNIYPGYVIIKNSMPGSEVMNDPTNDRSLAHGKLMHWYFGMTTAELVNNHGAVFGGAGIKPDPNTGKDEVRFNSWNLNTSDSTGPWASFHNSERVANPHEQALIGRILRGWMNGTVKCATNYTYAQIMALET